MLLLNLRLIFDRHLAFSIFELSDVYLQNIREVMKVLSGRDADEVQRIL